MTPFSERARRDLLACYEAALAAADPRGAVERALRREGSVLHIGGAQFELAALKGVQLLAAGKAAAAMARGAAAALGEQLAGGVLVTSRGNATGGAPVPIIEAGHPVPDEASVRGGEALLAAARRAAQGGQLALMLLSGGASALAEVPAPPLTLAELQEITGLLLRSGADINQINIVRKHFSAFKGGQLARAAAPAPMATLVLSDVVGSPLSAIGSGPTVADPSTFVDVRRALDAFGLRDRIPRAARKRLDEGLAGTIAETPKPGDPLFAHCAVQIIGDAALAAEAARACAESLGYRARVVDAQVEGDVEAFARKLPAYIDAARREGGRTCFLFAGETTVAVRGSGRGGRNQQLALAFAIECSRNPRVALAALATDGVDGPTDAAGAIVDGTTLAGVRASGIDPGRALADNNAYQALDGASALVRRGPTGTNVNDLVMLLVE